MIRRARIAVTFWLLCVAWRVLPKDNEGWHGIFDAGRTIRPHGWRQGGK